MALRRGCCQSQQAPPPTLCACWGHGCWRRCGCLGAATWTRPAVLPVSVRAQEMNFFLLLFWASSLGGWACGRGGGPWPGSCSPVTPPPLHGLGLSWEPSLSPLPHPKPHSDGACPGVCVQICWEPGFGDAATVSCTSSTHTFGRWASPETPRLLELPQHRLGTHPGPSS